MRRLQGSSLCEIAKKEPAPFPYRGRVPQFADTGDTGAEMSNREEQWKAIEGFERYEVSDFGRVRNAETGCIRKLHKNRYGYMVVALWNRGKAKSQQVHQLVARAFVGNKGDYTEVNHIDEDKTNNKASNLEWCSRKYNIYYGAARVKHARSKSRPVVQYLDGVEIARYESIKEATHALGCGAGSICQCCRKNPKRKHVHGFTFEYAEPRN